jgi:membrane-associated phospholipid phosphatase
MVGGRTARGPDQGLAAALLVPPAMLALYVLSSSLGQLRPASAGFHFAFERSIPIVPWMLVPYLSLDLLVVAGLLLCPGGAARRRLVASLLLATVIACAAFVIWPMELAHARQAPAGMWGEACRLLWFLDPSGNRCPSLHVAIAVVLWPAFARRCRSRAALGLLGLWWAALIASTLLLQQHHVVDVVTGAGLGIVSISVSRRCFSRSITSSAPGPNSHSAAVMPNARPV